MRWHERSAGIEVFDKDGSPVGVSQVAAKRVPSSSLPTLLHLAPLQAVRDTAITRCFLPAPIFLFPTLLMSALEKTALLKARPWLHMPFNTLACTAAFGLALPVSIALFPQKSTVSLLCHSSGELSTHLPQRQGSNERGSRP